MIPSSSKAKFKPLIKLRKDVWNNLFRKYLNKKKWQVLITILKRQKAFKARQPLKHRLKQYHYTTKILPKFPNYFRYKYQKNLFIRKTIKIIYGNLQEYKIKYYAQTSKLPLNFIQKLEQKPSIFLYRSKLVSTYGEASIHFMHKRIIINGCALIPNVISGDLIHFTPCFEKVLKRQVLYRSSKKFKYKRKNFYLFNEVNFDVIKFRFHFLNNIKYFKNHPFYIPFERTWRYYTRV